MPLDPELALDRGPCATGANRSHRLPPSPHPPQKIIIVTTTINPTHQPTTVATRPLSRHTKGSTNTRSTTTTGTTLCTRWCHTPWTSSESRRCSVGRGSVGTSCRLDVGLDFDRFTYVSPALHRLTHVTRRGAKLVVSSPPPQSNARARVTSGKVGLWRQLRRRINPALLAAALHWIGLHGALQCLGRRSQGGPSIIQGRRTGDRAPKHREFSAAGTYLLWLWL